jgi:hypothetical protein
MDADRPKAEQEEVERLAEDWITLWQSEIAALAADREAAEAWSAATSAWAALGAGWLRAAAAPPFGRPPAPWPPVRPADDGAVPPPRPAPAADAPDAGGGAGNARDGGPDAYPALRRRLAELERRLADLEGRPRRAAADPRPPRRRHPRA